MTELCDHLINVSKEYIDTEIQRYKDFLQLLSLNSCLSAVGYIRKKKDVRILKKYLMWA